MCTSLIPSRRDVARDPELYGLKVSCYPQLALWATGYVIGFADFARPLPQVLTSGDER